MFFWDILLMLNFMSMNSRFCFKHIMLLINNYKAFHMNNLSDTKLLPLLPPRLFRLQLGPPKNIHELEPDSHEYWKVLRKEHMLRFNRLHKGKKLQDPEPVKESPSVISCSLQICVHQTLQHSCNLTDSILSVSM